MLVSQCEKMPAAAAVEVFQNVVPAVVMSFWNNDTKEEFNCVLTQLIKVHWRILLTMYTLEFPLYRIVKIGDCEASEANPTISRSFQIFEAKFFDNIILGFDFIFER